MRMVPAGTDAGDLTLKAGSAIYGDSLSMAGNLYLVPGETYNHNISTIYLGNSGFAGGAIYIQADGSADDVSLALKAKGIGLIEIGSSGAGNLVLESDTTSIYGSLSVYGNLSLSANHDYTIGVANTNNADAYDLTIIGSNAGGTGGDWDGGNIFIYGGDPYGAGAPGEIYFGTGADGKLKEAGVDDTCVVTYNPLTGKLSYMTI